MNKNLFSDGLGHIDPDAVERMLRMEDDLARKAARRRYAWVKPVLIAAALALTLSAVLVIVPFIPKKLDIEYQPVKGPDQSVWVYYTNENGTQKRERVSLPGGAGNVFEAWKHLSEVDDAVEILGYEEVTDAQPSTTVVPGTLWEYLKQTLSPASGQKTVTVTLSAQITSCDNYDALIESLQKTLAKYAGVDAEQIRILIDGEQTAVVGGLQFYHSLQGGGPVVAELGTTLEITVGVTNISNQIIEYDLCSIDYWYVDALLTMDGAARIMHEECYILDEYLDTVISPGESRELRYRFIIPEQATCGVYDLVIWSGEKTFTFEDAVQVVGFGYTPSLAVSATEFHEFLIKYGFHQTDPEAFKQAVGMHTYLNDQSVLDIMNPYSVEYAPGYSGEEHGSNLFAYGYTRHPDGSCNNYFGGLALPGDMRLPHGITPGDRLVDSLHKMGVDPQTAQDTVERAQKLFEGEQIRLGDNFNTFCITRNRHGEYIIHYDFIAAPVDGDPAPPEYSLELVYNETNMVFVCFYVKAGYGDFSVEMISSPIFVSSMSSSALGKELDADETRQLLAIIDSTTRQDGKPDVTCDYYIVFDGFLFLYSTETGILMGQERYYEFSDEQRLIVNKIVANSTYAPDFQNIKLYENNMLVSLPNQVALQIKSALNNAEWHDGTLELEPLLWFDCDGTRVGYDYGIFFTTQHYWYADNYTEDCTNALRDAIVGLRTKEYNAIIYYAGAYYGHSEAVDEKLNGTVSFAMNINPHSLDEILYAHDDKQAVASFGYIVDCKNAVDLGVLITNNGAYFEQITKFAPDFSQGEIKLVITPAGEPPLGELTDEDAQKLREIFQRAEFSYCFEDHEAEYETRIEIGSYSIDYLSAWGDAKIGDWKATLSDEDCATVANIIGGYVNVE
ncbi:MAG: hypothetical protein E7594_03010 [Ruminococcaceae bacterium]|nr:hypothetical protein [Oscillospiraceae bacterium]